jgi:hypothetical protein
LYITFRADNTLDYTASYVGGGTFNNVNTAYTITGSTVNTTNVLPVLNSHEITWNGTTFESFTEMIGPPDGLYTSVAYDSYRILNFLIQYLGGGESAAESYEVIAFNAIRFGTTTLTFDRTSLTDSNGIRYILQCPLTCTGSDLDLARNYYASNSVRVFGQAYTMVPTSATKTSDTICHIEYDYTRTSDYVTGHDRRDFTYGLGCNKVVSSFTGSG